MTQPRIRIGTPTDVLDAVPALLGFYPTESIVGLFFEQTPAGLALYVTARMDVPTTPDAAAQMLHSINEAMSRTAMAILVIYTADQDEARDLIRTILANTPPGKVHATVLATLIGWTTVDPDQPDTIQWTNPYPTTTSTVAADLAAAGLYAMGTRDDLADSIATPDAETAADYALGRSLDPIPAEPTSADLDEMTEQVRRWISEYLRQPTTLIAEEAAYLAGRIQFGQPRDVLVGLLDRNTARNLAAMWQAVAGLTPNADALPVLGCLALSAWAASNGSLANVAIARANSLAAVGPGRSLVDLVSELIDRMVPPSAWDDLKPSL